MEKLTDETSQTLFMLVEINEKKDFSGKALEGLDVYIYNLLKNKIIYKGKVNMRKCWRFLNIKKIQMYTEDYMPYGNFNVEKMKEALDYYYYDGEIWLENTEYIILRLKSKLNEIFDIPLIVVIENNTLPENISFGNDWLQLAACFW